MVIVLAIDKDNDYGRKAGVKCPVIGEKDVLDAVNALGLADPEDSDTNVGFAAVKIAREIGGVPVIVCGEGKNSFKDDLMIGKQLDQVKNMLKDDEVIIVTDGAEDESVIPIVSSKFKIVGVERVTVKQLENVETIYYVIVKYLKEILSSRETSKIFLGVPGLVLLLIGLSVIISTWYPGFYSAVKNFIIGIGLLLFGGYIFKIGFGIDYTRPLKKDFITLSTYVIATFSIIMGIIHTYQLYNSGEKLVDVITYAVQVGFVALMVYILGQIVSEYLNGRKKLYYYLSFLTFVPALYSGIVLIMRYVFDGIIPVLTIAFYGAIIVLSVTLTAVIFRKSKK